MMTREDIKKYEDKARRILAALDNGSAPISWSEMDRPELVETIKRELIKQDADKHRRI